MSSKYRTSDFDYEYPPESIAQRPLDRRSDSKLLVLDRVTGQTAHRVFRDFLKLPDPGDVVVLNESKVIPARLRGLRDNGREAEILLVHAEPNGDWLAMVHPGGKLKLGRTVRFGNDAAAEIVEVVGGGLRRLRFTGSASVAELTARFGSVPLPPYIEREPEPGDRERYQTVYARLAGSVAAPTAGLHFTQRLLSQLRDREIEIAAVVLHVGPGTFKPVETETPAHHSLHAEWYSVPPETATVVNRAKVGGRRVWAVGTTTARVLETVGEAGTLQSATGWTNLFIYPPYRFRVVDALLTNFHLPRSTLLMLVAAFA
ncbi:MAG: tRNA preQ1(34) S-adenosylmethionine ribosyltransferase-isomerase QueA, partial [Gemmatimonadota bacterium]